MTGRRTFRLSALSAVGALVWTALASCHGAPAAQGPTAPSVTPRASITAKSGGTPAQRPTQPFRHPIPGMPPVIDNDVYSQTRAGMMAPGVRHDPAYLYVPDSAGSRVTVINPRTHRIVRVIPTGYLSQHVVPSYDLRTLITNSSYANELVEISPRTARRTRSFPMPRPYNLYFTPDGKTAVVMIEQDNTIRFADPRHFHTLKDLKPQGCLGPNHTDFSGNGRFFVVSCEFSGELLKVSTLGRRVISVLHLDPRPTAPAAAPMTLGRSVPQDVRISPDGTTFYVADMGTNELRLIDARSFRQIRTIGLPRMPHGLYPSRNGKELYISDRGAGKISVLDFATNRIADTWTIPGGGSPDMGGVSADGKTLWLSGRTDGVVYGFDTRTGKLTARIPVGGSPHGLAVWPQPGRYSLGHTGNMR